MKIWQFAQGMRQVRTLVFRKELSIGTIAEFPFGHLCAKIGFTCAPCPSHPLTVTIHSSDINVFLVLLSYQLAFQLNHHSMLLPLVITEFVKTIECSVSLAITAVDKAGVSRSEMLFVMAAEITSAGKGCSTSYIVVFKTVGIGISAGDGCDDAGSGNQQVS
jgi:hypothetical protein